MYEAVDEAQLPHDRRRQDVDQPVLGGLEALPAQQVLRRAEVRDRAVVSAGPAERIWAIRRHQPAAGLVRGISGAASGRQRSPSSWIKPLSIAPSGR